jgi:restriction system protein
MPLSEVRARVSVSEGLTPEDMQELLSSGQPVFTNRISWAVVYVAGAGLVEKVRRGVYRLTAGGERLLAQAPARIDKNVLRNYPAYVEWSARKSVRSPNRDTAPAPPDDSADTPEEVLDRAARQLHGALEGDVLDRVREAAPEFLERLVVDLLIAIGYGGGDAERGRVTGRSGDGGIDGTIREDALGLDEVYLQAKKYAGTTVGEGDLRNFAGAIDAANTTKGVFVTTAGFTKSAKDFVAKSPKRIVLIDGEKLACLMVDNDIGVRTWAKHEVKRIDDDYFDREDL